MQIVGLLNTHQKTVNLWLRKEILNKITSLHTEEEETEVAVTVAVTVTVTVCQS